MNKREISSEVFVSPRRTSPRKKVLIHDTKAWRSQTGNSDIELSKDDSENDTLQDRRKKRLRAAKQKLLQETMERKRRRQQKRAMAALNNQKVQQTLEQRKGLSRSLQNHLATVKSPSESEKPTVKSKQPKPVVPTKSHMKKIIRRKIIKRVLRKPVEPPLQDGKREVIDEEFYEEEVVDDHDFEEVTEYELQDEDEYDLQEVHSSSEFEIEEEVSDHSSNKDHDSEDLDTNSDEHGAGWENDSGAEQDDPFDVVPTEQDVDEDVTVEDDLIEELSSAEGDEERFFTEIRNRNEPDEEDNVSLSPSEQLRQEEEEFLREQEELFRLAAERQAEEEEDLRWEEEQLALEEEARRLASLEAEDQDQEGISQRKETLHDMLQSRPPLRSTKGIKQAGEESVLDKPIGYRPPSLLALVNQAKLELRPSPPEKHREQFVPVVLDAASIGRLLRLHEVCIEAQGKRNTKDFNTTSTDRSYSVWELNHSQRGQKRMPVTKKTRSTAQIMVNEAAALGKLRTRREVDPQGLSASMHGNEIDIDDLGDDKYDGAKVFRTEHLIDRMVGQNRRMKMTDWTPEYDDEEYEALDDVRLPTPAIPSFNPRPSTKSQEQLREEMSRAVAEGYWGRHYRLERPGAKLNVTQGCYCKYCSSPNAWQTFAYQKKWAESRLPARDKIDPDADPSQFGYLTRLYLPQESPDDVSFVDLNDMENTKNLDLGSVDGTCSVDFSLGTLDLIDESDENSSSHDSFAHHEDETHETHSIVHDSFAGDSASFAMSSNDNASKHSEQSAVNDVETLPTQMAHDNLLIHDSSGRDAHTTVTKGFVQESQDETCSPNNDGPSETFDPETTDTHNQLQSETFTALLSTEQSPTDAMAIASDHSQADKDIIMSDHGPADENMISSEQRPDDKTMISSEHSPTVKAMISSEPSLANKKIKSVERVSETKKQSRFRPLKWMKKAFRPSIRSNEDGRQGSLTIDDVLHDTAVEESRQQPSQKASVGDDVVPAEVEENALLENTSTGMENESSGDVIPIFNGGSGPLVDVQVKDGLENTNQAELIALNPCESTSEGIITDHQAQEQEIVAVNEPLTKKPKESVPVEASVDDDDGVEISLNHPQIVTESTSPPQLQSAPPSSEGASPFTRTSIALLPKPRKSNGILANLLEYQTKHVSARKIQSSRTSTELAPGPINETSSLLAGESESHVAGTREGHVLNANNEQLITDTDKKGIQDEQLECHGFSLNIPPPLPTSHLEASNKTDAITERSVGYETHQHVHISNDTLGRELNVEQVLNDEQKVQAATPEKLIGTLSNVENSNSEPEPPILTKIGDSLNECMHDQVPKPEEPQASAVQPAHCETGPRHLESTEQATATEHRGASFDGNDCKFPGSTFTSHPPPDATMAMKDVSSFHWEVDDGGIPGKHQELGDSEGSVVQDKNALTMATKPTLGASHKTSEPSTRFSGGVHASVKVPTMSGTDEIASQNKFGSSVVRNLETRASIASHADTFVETLQPAPKERVSPSDIDTTTLKTEATNTKSVDSNLASKPSSGVSTGTLKATSAKARLGILAQLRAKKEHLDEAKAPGNVQIMSNPLPTTREIICQFTFPGNQDIVGKDVSQQLGPFPVAPVNSPDKVDVDKLSEAKAPAESVHLRQMPGQVNPRQPEPTKPGVSRRSETLNGGNVIAKSKGALEPTTHETKFLPIKGTEAVASTTPPQRLSKIVPGGSTFKAAYSNRNLFEQNVPPSIGKSSPSSTSPELQRQKELLSKQSGEKERNSILATPQSHAPVVVTTENSLKTQPRIVQASTTSGGVTEKPNATSAKARLGILAQLRAKKEHLEEAMAQENTQIMTKPHPPPSATVAKKLAVADNQGIFGKDAAIVENPSTVLPAEHHPVPLPTAPVASLDKVDVVKLSEANSPPEPLLLRPMPGQVNQSMEADGKLQGSKVSPIKGTEDVASTTPPQRLSKIVPGGSTFKAAYSNRNLFEQNASPSMGKSSPSSTARTVDDRSVKSDDDRNLQETKVLPVTDAETVAKTTPPQRLSKIVPGGSTFTAAYANRNLFDQNASPSTGKSSPSSTARTVDDRSVKSDDDRNLHETQVLPVKDTETPAKTTPPQRLSKIVPGGSTFTAAYSNRNLFEQNASPSTGKSSLSSTARTVDDRSVKSDDDRNLQETQVLPVTDTETVAKTTPPQRLSKIVPGGSTFTAAYANRNLFEQNVSPSMGKSSPSSTARTVEDQSANSNNNGGLEAGPMVETVLQETKKLSLNDNVGAVSTTANKRISKIVPGGSTFTAAYSNRNLFEQNVSPSVGKSSPSPTARTVDDPSAKSNSIGGLESVPVVEKNLQEAKVAPVNNTAAVASTTANKRLSKIVPGGSTFTAAFSNRNLFEQNVTAQPRILQASKSSDGDTREGEPARGVSRTSSLNVRNIPQSSGSTSRPADGSFRTVVRTKSLDL